MVRTWSSVAVILSRMEVVMIDDGMFGGDLDWLKELVHVLVGVVPVAVRE